MAEPRRLPAHLGPPAHWTDAQQLALAVPTQADQQAAAAAWRRWVPGPLAGLLDATAPKEKR